MQRYGSRTMTKRDNRAAAAQYLVCAREPNAVTLTRSYGILPAEAERMVRDELGKRSRLI